MQKPFSSTDITLNRLCACKSYSLSNNRLDFSAIIVWVMILSSYNNISAAMGVVIESEIWEPNKSLYVFLFISCIVSIFCLPTKAVANVPPPSFLRFQRKFLLLYAISSVMEGLWAVLGEHELAYYGFSKEQTLKFLGIGYAVSLFIGSFLGMLSDSIGHQKFCFLFYMLHLFLSIWKIFVGTSTIWLTSIFPSLASSIFSFSFETWMVVEHGKIFQLGQRQDLLNDIFWLMTFSESACFIGSEVLANYLINGNVNQNIKSIWIEVAVLAVVGIIYVTRGSQQAPQTACLTAYRISFARHAISDKRIWLLSWTQACTHFSVAAFWILWVPTIVADGREVSLGLIYPCLLGSKILGSTGFAWLFHGPIEEYLVYVFTMMGLALSVVAYDYQDIGVLVTLFCLFQTCMGVVLPSLARLRTTYAPNEIRGGLMSLSLMPANAAVLFLLVLRCNYYIGNSTITSFAAFGLFLAAGCMYLLRKRGKQPHQSRHNL